MSNLRTYLEAAILVLFGCALIWQAVRTLPPYTVHYQAVGPGARWQRRYTFDRRQLRRWVGMRLFEVMPLLLCCSAWWRRVQLPHKALMAYTAEMQYAAERAVAPMDVAERARMHQMLVGVDGMIGGLPQEAWM